MGASPGPCEVSACPFVPIRPAGFSEPENFNDPATSSGCVGAFVPIPTFCAFVLLEAVKQKIASTNKWEILIENFFILSNYFIVNFIFESSKLKDYQHGF